MSINMFSKRKLYLLLLLNGLCLAPCYSQNKRLNHTSQFWSEVDLVGRINKTLKWELDLQYSGQSLYGRLNLFRYPSQVTIRPWLHYYPLKHLRISAFWGLWYNLAIPAAGARKYPELRTAVQANYYVPIRKHLLLNRIRPELREIRNREGRFELVGRVRYELKYQYLLLHDSYDQNSLYLIAQDELFANLGSEVTGTRLFDQNRIFVGFGYGVTDNIAIETGYFNQYQFHAHDPNADMNHAWQLSLIIDGLNGKI